MEGKLQDPLPEVVFASSDQATSRAIARAVKDGRLRKLVRRVYTSNLTDPSEELVRRNLYPVLGKLYPGAMLSHRSALEGRPTNNWNIFLTYRYTKKEALPGVTVRLLEGPPPTASDLPFLEGLFISSESRAFLENMQPSRSRGSDPKTLPVELIEARLERILQIRGESKLNALRDRARSLAAELGMEREFQRLDKLIAALLRSGPARLLVSPLARARAFGASYDPNRLRLFDELFAALKSTELPAIPEADYSPDGLRNMAFFDAYFSNYIEGTIFELEEAQAIVWRGEIPATRPADAHDILGTYRIVVDTREMSRVPDSQQDFLDLLQSRHRTILESRPEVTPGIFKERSNRAGQTLFVAPELVRGTLVKGFEFYRALEAPLEKAMFMMFAVAEVHPFVDGNGRIARVMMNAELVHGGLRRILIPTVYREDYLLALRALSRQGNPEPYIRMLERAHRFSGRIDFSSYGRAHDFLVRSNAFEEPTEARLRDQLS